MNYSCDSFAAIEALFERHAPLLLRVGDYQENRGSTRRGLPMQYRPPINGKIIARMQRLRNEGMTIGDIARKCGCTWSTAWRHTIRPSAPASLRETSNQEVQS